MGVANRKLATPILLYSTHELLPNFQTPQQVEILFGIDPLHVIQQTAPPTDFKCSVIWAMRLVSSATWISGEPESEAPRPNSPFSCCFRSVVNGIAVPAFHSLWCAALPGLELLCPNDPAVCLS